mmetsp:Transcript_2562/g.6789  ORF Transcript_2562/g.6789 Transcript_2562/m.6789 type:complete len:235 (-) Transcript_2562:624-1328(-)
MLLDSQPGSLGQIGYRMADRRLAAGRVESGIPIRIRRRRLGVGQAKNGIRNHLGGRLGVGHVESRMIRITPRFPHRRLADGGDNLVSECGVAVGHVEAGIPQTTGRGLTPGSVDDGIGSKKVCRGLAVGPAQSGICELRIIVLGFGFSFCFAFRLLTQFLLRRLWLLPHFLLRRSLPWRWLRLRSPRREVSLSILRREHGYLGSTRPPQESPSGPPLLLWRWRQLLLLLWHWHG